MLRGMYTAASGMLMQQRKHDAITHNINNVLTPGFKQVEAVSRSFPEVLLTKMQKEDNQLKTTPLGRIHTGVFVEENISTFLQGNIQETQRPYDFALVSQIEVEGVQFDTSGKYVAPDGTISHRPQAFFTLMNSDGEIRYTRNGSFQVNVMGELVSSDGNRVMGVDGEPLILLDPEMDMPFENIQLTPHGQLTTESGQEIGGLLISRIDQPYQLIAEGQGMYRLAPDNQASATIAEWNDQIQIHQGFIERSNVDSARMMVDLNVALRSYEANQVIIQYYDRSLDKAVNEVGRV